MKLVTFTIEVNDWRDRKPDDRNIEKLMDEVRHAVRFNVREVANELDVALGIKETIHA